jgi:dienelactone hydrolase
MADSRNLNPFEFFRLRARKHQPRMAFTGRTRAQFAKWQSKTLPAVLATVGHRPPAMPAKPELVVRWEEDGLVKERWLINTQPDLSAYVLLFRPADLKRGEKRPAIFCAHGHGKYGQDSVMGMDHDPDRANGIAFHNYAYGLEMAKKGFVTYGIDWLGFGKRDSRSKPHDLNKSGQRDPCNIHYLCATLLGTTVMAINLRDARAATDFVSGQSFVDANNLGVMGLSFGGTMTTWLALDDQRYKAADIICYAGPFHDFAFNTYNCCGSQITPGLFDLVDTFDLQGLIAPRPLLVELGIHDQCFNIENTLKGHYKPLEKIYQAAGAPITLDLFPKDHAWGANHSESFFRQHLHAKW